MADCKNLLREIRETFQAISRSYWPVLNEVLGTLVTEEQHFGWVTPGRELYSVQAFASKWINDAMCSWDEWQPGGKSGGTGGFIEPCMSEIQLGKMHDAISQNAAEVVGEIAHLETDKCCHGFTVNGIFDGNIYELQDHVAFEYDVQLDRILLDRAMWEVAATVFGDCPICCILQEAKHVDVALDELPPPRRSHGFSLDKQTHQEVQPPQDFGWSKPSTMPTHFEGAAAIRDGPKPAVSSKPSAMPTHYEKAGCHSPIWPSPETEK